MEWVASKRHMTAEHRLALTVQTLQADVHSSPASSRLNWPSRRFKWACPFRRKTKSGFCACAITFQTQSTSLSVLYCENAAEKYLLTLDCVFLLCIWQTRNTKHESLSEIKMPHYGLYNVASPVCLWLTDGSKRVEVQHCSSWAGEGGGGGCTEYNYAQKERLIAEAKLGYGPFVC